ncbi:MAG TPA: anthrone oxygenase family protein [Polyangiaceae bacterium]|jgi:uncharacterized membrane protein|nr:anthrone oxygenase family protein [Polyangiaceae bacterium]
MVRLDLFTVLAALGSGLMAGFFFAFSVCVMKALGKLPPEQGIAAMQSINVVVINPVFLTVFLGTGVACAVGILQSLLRWQDSGAACLLAGGALYLLGAILVTMVFNVPRNNALAGLAPTSAEGAKLWAAYLSSWTAWNHVRTMASLAAAALLTVGLRFRA